MTSIAVIGAGLSGLTFASNLSKLSKITVFEKSRGVGGRMSTKRIDDFAFDHGAQYFTVKDEKFKEFVSDVESQGMAAEWKGSIKVLNNGEEKETHDPNQKRYVGVEGMPSLSKYLSKDMDIKLNTRIVKLERHDRVWSLIDEKGEKQGPFDIVVVTAPPEQVPPLIAGSGISAEIQQKIAQCGSDPTWCGMLGFSSKLPLKSDGYFVENSGLSWIARNNSKPGRKSEKESWVLHGSAEFSKKHLEKTPEEVLPLLKSEFEKATKILLSDFSLQVESAHRWRFSKASKPLEDGSYFDGDIGLGICGDWICGTRVEGAFLSGFNLAEKVRAKL